MPMELIPVEIVALVEEDQTESSIVVLHDRLTNRILPIWIGDPEARAIAVSLNNITMPRPLTHQLLLNTIAELGFSVSKIVVDRMQEQTYFATIYLKNGKDGIVKIDARPSDSIAVALASKSSIFVAKEVMDKGGQNNPFPLPTEQTTMFQQEGPRKLELSKRDLERVADTLKRAREREEQSARE